MGTIIGKLSWTTTIGHELKYKIQENLLCRLCEIEETGNRETIIDQWLHSIHRSQTNHFEKRGMNRNDNNEKRKINMPTSKLHKGKHEVWTNRETTEQQPELERNTKD